MPQFEVVKAVYDTNTVVSGILRRGIPQLTLLLVAIGKVNLYVSPPLLEEYRQVILRRPRFQNIPNAQQALELIEAQATRVYPISTLNVTLDPDDNKVVECALKGEVGYIVTGNKRHYPFSTYEGIKIVNAREFMEEVAPIFLLLWELLTRQ
jgi:putative PIN family toxin of toxin-antitoxin system